MTSMALFAPQEAKIDEVRSLLEPEGLTVRSHTLCSIGAIEPIDESVDGAVVVIPTQGVVAIGEPTSTVRKALGPDRWLLLCCPHLALSDRRQLHHCGASEIVTPRAWEPAPVSERILGALIVHGSIEPRTFGAMRGGVRVMRDLYQAVDKVARYPDPVLILGETGTGKELVAREIHLRSGRAGKPFVPVDCAALPPDLLQSELFGHVQGAFTGAVSSRTGLLLEAAAGTVFLDEIGDLDPVSQAKLLRVLEERAVRPVGSNKWTGIDARLVFATNRDLERACALGKFRQDLYARLSGLTVHLPPLRNRRADIPWLAEAFLDEFNRLESHNRTFPPGALDCLFRYTWPGNVRELRQVIREAAIFASSHSGPVSIGVLQDRSRGREVAGGDNTINFDPTADCWQDVLDRAWESYSKALLQVTGNNKALAAKRAGMSRSAFLERLRRTSP